MSWISQAYMVEMKEAFEKVEQCFILIDILQYID